MSYQTVFERYELKYILTADRQAKILDAMARYMELDKYGQTTIRNIYYDTEDYRLIRKSIEKPAYKEKLRIRSYAQCAADSTVFVELKKKYNSLVFKRRLPLPEQEATAWVKERNCHRTDTQISREIEYFMGYYETLHPVLFLSYDRTAYYTKEKSDFRVTFDDNILCRQEALTLQEDAWGVPILPEDAVLMEIKCSGSIPLWMVSALSENRVYRTSFSKYGTAYKTLIFPEIKKNNMEEFSYA